MLVAEVERVAHIDVAVDLCHTVTTGPTQRPVRFRVSMCGGVDCENAVVLAVTGEVDLSNGTQLGAIFEYVQRDNPRVLVIDLSRVAFLGSAGLRTLVEARHRAGDGAVRVVAAFGSARRAIETTALDQVLPLFFTVDDALETNLA